MVEARRAGSGQAGFTLVEMIVCLALAALIGVLLVNAVRITGSASSAVTAVTLRNNMTSGYDRPQPRRSAAADRRRRRHPSSVLA